MKRCVILLSIALLAPSAASAQSVVPHNHAPTPQPQPVATHHVPPPATPAPRRSPFYRRTPAP